MDPVSFLKQYQPEQESIRNQILLSRERLNRVHVSDQMVELAATIGIALEAEGHRSDITLVKTAITLAAWRGQDAVGHDHINQAAYLVLPHRMRRQPFEASSGIELRLQALLNPEAKLQI